MNIPNIYLKPVIEFKEDGNTWTTNEKDTYTTYFNNILNAQSSGKIPFFFYSSNNINLEKLVMMKVPLAAGAGAAHLGNYVMIIDNTYHAGLTMEDFFYHEYGHLITYWGQINCCGNFFNVESIANVTQSEIENRNPTKNVFEGTTWYEGTAFAEQWYDHAEKWGYPIIGYQDIYSTTREDREFGYIFLTVLYHRVKLINDISDVNVGNAITNYALRNARIIENRENLATMILPLYDVGDCILGGGKLLTITAIDIYYGIRQYYVIDIYNVEGHIPLSIGNTYPLCPVCTQPIGNLTII